MSVERYMVDDAGTVIDKITRKNYELAYELVDILNHYETLLNELFDENDELKEDRNELFIRERDAKNNCRKLKYENEQLKKQKQQYKGQRDYLLFVIERTCSKELFEETKSYLMKIE